MTKLTTILSEIKTQGAPKTFKAARMRDLISKEEMDFLIDIEFFEGGNEWFRDENIKNFSERNGHNEEDIKFKNIIVKLYKIMKTNKIEVVCV